MNYLKIIILTAIFLFGFGSIFKAQNMNDSIKKQTAGRDALGTFASKFAELNDY